MEEKELPDTQSQDYVDPSQSQEGPQPWGRLAPCISSLTSVELFDSTFTFGRAPHCSVVVDEANFANIINISKVHFRLINESNVVYLLDLSKNGTFLNGRRIGRSQKHIICSNDIISLVGPNDKVYTFHDNSIEDLYLPRELRMKYHVSTILGKGACGEVRLAREKQTCKAFAMKKIIKAKSSGSLATLNTPNKIQTEISILTSLSNPFIIQMIEAFESDKEVYIVLEYLPGGELTSRILQLGRLFPEAEVKYIFYQILLGLQYLHASGVTHRDIKAGNILLMSDTQFPAVKITDFGLSKILDDVSIMETTCGTISYVAPEIISYSRYYTKKVDVWSLGVLLFYMLCRELPFTGSDRETVASTILSGKIIWKSKITKSVSFASKDLTKKMLTVNPNVRISVEDIFRHPWIETDRRMQTMVNALMVDEIDTESDSDNMVPTKRIRLASSNN